MNKLWNNRATEIVEFYTLQEYIYSAYTPALLQTDLDEGDTFVNQLSEVNQIYDHFEREIHRRASIRDVVLDDDGCIDWSRGFYDSVKALHMDAAIRTMLSEIADRYQEVMVANPDEKIKNLIKLRSDSLVFRVPSDIKKHKSLRDLIEKRLSGSDLIGRLGEDDITIGGDTELYFNQFSKDLKELSGNNDLTAETVTDEVVTDCVKKLLKKIYAEKKEEILRNPEKSLSNLSKNKEAGQEGRE